MKHVALLWILKCVFSDKITFIGLFLCSERFFVYTRQEYRMSGTKLRTATMVPYMYRNCMDLIMFRCGISPLFQIPNTALQTGRSRVRFPMVSLEFFIGIILSVALWHWGRLSL
jgi:hypothetical protein